MQLLSLIHTSDTAKVYCRRIDLHLWESLDVYHALTGKPGLGCTSNDTTLARGDLAVDMASICSCETLIGHKSNAACDNRIGHSWSKALIKPP